MGAFILSLMGWPRMLFDWLVKDMRRVIILALVVACASGWVANWFTDRSRDRWRNAASAEQIAHAGTIINYRIAALRAQQIAFANRVTVEARWRAQMKEAVDAKAAYERDFRANLAVWLQRNAAPAVSGGGAVGADLSAPAAVPTGTLHDATAAIIPVVDLERCTTAFSNLAALIRLYNAASAVETSPSGGSDQSLPSSPGG